MQTAIYPGKTWFDTDGNRIQAHGGAMFYENDTFYWYGEDKTHTDGVSKIWTSGVRFYSSNDLYNWKNEGLIMPPVPGDETSPFYPQRRLDRPHIVFNRHTNKYVCWLKFSGDDACFAILTADRLLGSYTLIKDHFRPYGKKVGDFDLVADEATGEGYLYFDGDHAGTLAVKLTDDYLDVTPTHTEQFAGLYPPFCREGQSHCVRGGKHYLFTSGMIGYLPNPSQVAVAERYLGPYTVQGDPHQNDASSASFNSQISYIFKHPHKDLYIAMADRWVPGYEMTKEKYQAFVRCIGARFNPERHKALPEDGPMLMASPMLQSANTSLADYVWLPVYFDGDRAYIQWQNEWRVEDECSEQKKA